MASLLGHGRTGEADGDGVAHLGTEDRTKAGDTGRDPDLTEGRVDPGRHAGAFRRHHTDSGGGERNVDKAGADTGDNETGDEVGPPGVDGQAAHEQQARADGHEARADEQLGRHAFGEPSGDGGGHENRPTEHQEADAGGDGRQAEHALHVQHEIGEHREEAGGQPERGEQTPVEGRLTQQGEVEHRLGLDGLGDAERHQQHSRPDQAPGDLGRAPAVGAAADEPVDQRAERAGERHQAEPVDPTGVRIAGLGDREQSDRDRDNANRKVHEEDPSPGQPAGQHPAEDRAHSDRHAGDGPEDPEGDPAVAAAKRVGEQRQGRREHDRTADTLPGPGQDEEQRGLREAAQQRPDGEHGRADGEHQPSTEPVRQRAGRQQQGGQRQSVGVDRPLQVRQRGAERPPDVRQRHVHDRDVKQQHEDADADRRERPPLPLHGSSPDRPLTDTCLTIN